MKFDEWVRFRPDHDRLELVNLVYYETTGKCQRICNRIEDCGNRKHGGVLIDVDAYNLAKSQNKAIQTTRNNLIMYRFHSDYFIAFMESIEDAIKTDSNVIDTTKFTMIKYHTGQLFHGPTLYHSK